MKKSFLIVFLCGLILTACQQEWADPSEMEESRIVFRLYDAAYEGETLNRQARVKNAGKMYDRVEFYVVDEAGRVVSNFILQALKNEDITIYGDGTQTRSFCYVDDLVDGMIRMMNNPQKFIGPVNLGNPNERSILDFAKLIIEMTGSKSQIIYRPLPQDDPVQRKPDISLAKKELNWEPYTDIKTGLEKTIEYFKTKI